MSAEFVARLEGVWMSYPRWSKTMSRMNGFVSSPRRWSELLGDGEPVLRGIDLEIRPGSSVAVIGGNAAGKSTLLALLGGVLRPRAGRVEILGRVCPLLDVQAGFRRELTGRENAVLLGALLGAKSAHISARIDEVQRNCGLGSAFDAPVQTYSSGMPARLSLAVAALLEPDLLLVDEHIASADARFRAVHREFLPAQRRRGAALVIATQSLEVAAELCEEAVWLEEGVVKSSGPIGAVVERYRRSYSA
ncbi:MAG: ATP-binding cassette domain-containing protein [Elusimicrobia bacterium]|nr:ATP-binding cassette domain-containing protein [Elusimicrobiota bacterium]